jgi:hypothetical protein
VGSNASGGDSAVRGLRGQSGGIMYLGRLKGFGPSEVELSCFSFVHFHFSFLVFKVEFKSVF